jgi:hypothetical protein
VGKRQGGREKEARAEAAEAQGEAEVRLWKLNMAHVKINRLISFSNCLV